jgi:hypothetical protein
MPVLQRRNGNSGLGLAKMPSANSLVQGGAMKVALKNERWQPLYNSKVIAAIAGSQELVFSQITESGIALTNMRGNTFTPSPNTFDLMGVSVHVAYGTAIGDANLFYNSSGLQINTQDKDYVRLTLGIIPSGAGLQGFVSTTVAATTLFGYSNGLPQPGAFFPLHRKGRAIRFQSNEQPELKIMINSGAVAFSATVRVWLVLHGMLFGGVN